MKPTLFLAFSVIWALVWIIADYWVTKYEPMPLDLKPSRYRPWGYWSEYLARAQRGSKMAKVLLAGSVVPPLFILLLFFWPAVS